MEGVYLTLSVLIILYTALGITEFSLWAGNKLYDKWIAYRLRRNYKKLYAFVKDVPEWGIDSPEDMKGE